MSDDVIAVVGAGIMGSGIARVLAATGREVHLFDARPGVAEAVATTASSVGVRAASSLRAAVSGAGVIVEAIAEELQSKIALYREIEALESHAVLLSNTSTLLPSRLSEHLRDPSRFLVTHFFNPADRVPLVEVVPSPMTAPDVVAQVRELLVVAGKSPVVLAREVPGFVANRLQAALVREAMSLVRTGVATQEVVDEVVVAALGPRWAAAGPFAVMDLGGLDTWAALCEELFPDLANDSAAPTRLGQLVAEGDLGAKTGRGFYAYTAESTAATQAAIAVRFKRGPESPDHSPSAPGR